MHEVTGGLRGSVGVGTSKLIAKIASDLDKPDGLVVVPPGTEARAAAPMKVTVIPGVGPATAERLRRAGVRTVADLEPLTEDELVRLVGQAHGTSLFHLARADDDRPVVAERETKSVSVEDTYDTDLVDRGLLDGLLDRQATGVAERLQQGPAVRPDRDGEGPAARLHHAHPLGDPGRLPPTPPGWSPGWRAGCSPRSTPPAGSGCSASGSRAGGLDPGGPLRGVRRRAGAGPRRPELERFTRGRRWAPGMDVAHTEHGQGWVWGSGVGRVTVRFETAETGPGPVRTFWADDPELAPLRRPRPRPTSSAHHEPDLVTGRSCAHAARSSGCTTPTTG